MNIQKKKEAVIITQRHMHFLQKTDNDAFHPDIHHADQTVPEYQGEPFFLVASYRSSHMRHTPDRYPYKMSILCSLHYPKSIGSGAGNN